MTKRLQPLFAHEEKRHRAPALKRKKESVVYASATSSLGTIVVALSEFGIVSVLHGEDVNEMVERLQKRFPNIEFNQNAKAMTLTMEKVVHFIDHPRSTFSLPLNMRGTVFQRKVWNAALAIPRGETSTYSAIATSIGSPRAMRAVGTACTNNHFSILVPCHRVLPKGTSLSDHIRAGSKRRRALFARDGS